MSMRNYLRELDYDGPDPTPEEQLRASGKRSLVGLFVVNLLAIIGIACVLMSGAHGQTLTPPTRISPYDWACLAANGAVLSNHQRFDTAFVACYNNAEGAEIVGGRYRIARVTPPDPEPPTCPAKPADDTRAGVCPAGTTGSWTQTRTYSSAASPICWQAGEWLPVAPPAGACSAPPPATLPAVTGISATVSASTTSLGNYNVALSWLTVAGAERYAIERCTGASCTSNFIALGTTTNTAYTNSNIPAGLTYRYRISGTSATATGTWSALRSVTTPTPTTPPPPPPAGTGTASLSWTPPTQNTDGTALTNLAGYRIVYGTAAGSLTRTIQVPNAALSTYIVDALAAGTWYFAVSAYTSAGLESVLSNTVTKTVQ
jgi:hypothetical protein